MLLLILLLLVVQGLRKVSKKLMTLYRWLLLKNVIGLGKSLRLQKLGLNLT
jgi:hypothetical protein